MKGIVEHEQNEEELVLFCIPTSTYQRLSLAARRKNKTVAQVVAEAIDIALEDREASVHRSGGGPMQSR